VDTQAKYSIYNAVTQSTTANKIRVLLKLKSTWFDLLWICCTTNAQQTENCTTNRTRGAWGLGYVNVQLDRLPNDLGYNKTISNYTDGSQKTDKR